MGSQLRFDPSFFGLALRAAAEADAFLFSARKDLPITRCPTRAGLRLTSPSKASGESDIQRSLHIKDPRDACPVTLDVSPVTRTSFLSPYSRVPSTRCSGEWARRETREARDPAYPIAGRCFFVRHACRVWNLPSRSVEGDRHSAGQWFLE